MNYCDKFLKENPKKWKSSRKMKCFSSTGLSIRPLRAVQRTWCDLYDINGSSIV